MNIRTKRGARRKYNALINKLYREHPIEGLNYGWDMPTLKICVPDIYNEIVEIKRMYNSLPD